MANARRGEIEIELLDIKYKLIIDNDVISEFEDFADVCFIQLAIKATNCYAEAIQFTNTLHRAEVMTSGHFLLVCNNAVL